MARLNYINGVIPSIAKRIAKFTFNSTFHKFEVDEDNQEYVVYLTKDPDERVLSHFKKHWPGFKILIISTTES
jgi:hypothetical protein